jgi:S1-C subfamily serine protease
MAQEAEMTLDDPSSRGIDDVMARAVTDTAPVWPPYEAGGGMMPVPTERAWRDSRPRRLALLPLVVALCLLSAMVGGFVGASITQGSVGGVNVAAAGATDTNGSLARALSRTASDANKAASGVVAVAAAAAPSVVTIQAQSSGFGRHFPGGVSSSTGSGFVVGSGGWILTCDHVVAGADTVSVTLADGRSFDASVKAEDGGLDLALLKIGAKDLPAMKLGVSGTLQVGQKAIVVGSPLGDYPGSVTEGVISGLERTITISAFSDRPGSTFSHLIQTDAAINPGNSGGPLLDATGEVVGIVSAESGTAQGIGFAIPVDLAQPLLGQAGV